MKSEAQIKTELEDILCSSSGQPQEMLTRMNEYVNGLSDEEHDFACDYIESRRMIVDNLLPRN